MSDIEQRFESLRAALAAHGLATVLELLNRGVPHRYSAAYRLKGAILRNHLLVDKLGEPRPEYLVAVPFDTSFCQFAFRQGVFVTTDSVSDHRLDGHPFQGVVISYTGVPVTDGSESDEIVGSLCHFDLVPRNLEPDEFELLRRVSRLITLDMLEQ